LKYSGIIPADWELAAPPVQNASTAQVSFRNGINILAQANRIIFDQVISNNNSTEVWIAAIAQRYINTLPQMSYQSISSNFIGYVPFSEADQDTHCSLFKNLLREGSWQEIDQTRAQVSLKLTYTFEASQLNLNIGTAKIQLPEQKLISAALFSASFDYAITGETQTERLESLAQAIDRWQADFEQYQDVIKTKFLKLERDRPAQNRSSKSSFNQTLSKSEQPEFRVSVTPID
jgi:ribosome-associated toxin RatA of RatAB toxin-antitoxin module